MKYDELVRSVAVGTSVTRRQADALILATLTTLSEHISPEETHDLLAQLPKSFKERVPVTSERTIMQPADFVARTAELLDGIPIEQADVQVRVVFATLTDAVNAGEMRDIFEELGDEYADLLGRAPLARPAVETGPSAGTNVVDAVLHTVLDTVSAVATLAASAAGAVIDAARHAAGSGLRLVTRPLDAIRPR